jgi:hypothetical protein
MNLSLYMKIIDILSTIAYISNITDYIHKLSILHEYKQIYYQYN